MEAAASAAPGSTRGLFLVLRLVAGFLLLLLLGAHGLSSSSDNTGAFPPLRSQESVKIKVSMLGNNGDNQDEQVVLNISYVNGQVYVNDFALKSGVARIKFHTLILGSGNSDRSHPQRIGIVSVRIMVHEWPMASSSDLQLIVVQEEVTEIDGMQVQQNEISEIDILVKDKQVLRHTNYTVPLKESMLYSIPRENDALFTLPNVAGKVAHHLLQDIPKKMPSPAWDTLEMALKDILPISPTQRLSLDIESPLQTTSHYLLRQVETTVDEEPMPGKLPETPLRAEPPSSYKVMCQWVEDLREELCKIWLQSLPVFFSLMEVIVLGVTGAVIIIKALKMFCPSCEPRGILQLDANFISVVAISLPVLPDIPEKTDNVEEKSI